MATETYQEQLERVQQAIADIEAGAQTYTLSAAGVIRTVTRGTLKDLYEREQRLRVMVTREQNGGGMTVQRVTPL